MLQSLLKFGNEIILSDIFLYFSGHELVHEGVILERV